MYFDANEETYEKVTVFDIPMLFSNFRIVRNTIPKGLCAYDVRHNEEGDPCQIKDYILVNHFGTLISNKPLPLDISGALDVNCYEDWNFEGYCCTLAEYVKEDTYESRGN